jgi:hypothetical protein
MLYWQDFGENNHTAANKDSDTAQPHSTNTNGLCWTDHHRRPAIHGDDHQGSLVDWLGSQHPESRHVWSFKSRESSTVATTSS